MLDSKRYMLYLLHRAYKLYILLGGLNFMPVYEILYIEKYSGKFVDQNGQEVSFEKARIGCKFPGRNCTQFTDFGVSLDIAKKFVVGDKVQPCFNQRGKIFDLILAND